MAVTFTAVSRTTRADGGSYPQPVFTGATGFAAGDICVLAVVTEDNDLSSISASNDATIGFSGWTHTSGLTTSDEHMQLWISTVLTSTQATGLASTTFTGSDNHDAWSANILKVSGATLPLASAPTATTSSGGPHAPLVVPSFTPSPLPSTGLIWYVGESFGGTTTPTTPSGWTAVTSGWSSVGDTDQSFGFFSKDLTAASGSVSITDTTSALGNNWGISLAFAPASGGSTSASAAAPLALSLAATGLALPVPIAGYSFDENVGTTGQDSYGSRNMIVNAWNTGHTNSGAKGDSTHRAAYYSGAIFTTPTAWSAMAWVSPATTGSGDIIGVYDASGAGYVCIYWTDSTHIKLAVQDSGAYVESSAISMATTGWTHLAYTVAPTSVILYINGVSAVTLAHSGTFVSQTLFAVGGNNTKSTGTYDDARLFSVTVPAAAIPYFRDTPVPPAAPAPTTASATIALALTTDPHKPTAAANHAAMPITLSTLGIAQATAIASASIALNLSEAAQAQGRASAAASLALTEVAAAKGNASAAATMNLASAGNAIGTAVASAGIVLNISMKAAQTVAQGSLFAFYAQFSGLGAGDLTDHEAAYWRLHSALAPNQGTTNDHIISALNTLYSSSEPDINVLLYKFYDTDGLGGSFQDAMDRFVDANVDPFAV